MSATSSSDLLKKFTQLIVNEFGAQYLNRCPTEKEKRCVYEAMQKRGFPGAFASWDCKHFNWKNCPVCLAGQYKGKEGSKTLILESICDPDLYLWYVFFGEPGSLNDFRLTSMKSMADGAIGSIFWSMVFIQSG